MGNFIVLYFIFDVNLFLLASCVTNESMLSFLNPDKNLADRLWPALRGDWLVCVTPLLMLRLHYRLHRGDFSTFADESLYHILHICQCSTWNIFKSNKRQQPFLQTLVPWTSAHIVLCLWTSSTAYSTIFRIYPCQPRHCRNIAVFLFLIIFFMRKL